MDLFLKNDYSLYTEPMKMFPKYIYTIKQVNKHTNKKKIYKQQIYVKEPDLNG